VSAQFHDLKIGARTPPRGAATQLSIRRASHSPSPIVTLPSPPHETASEVRIEIPETPSTPSRSPPPTPTLGPVPSPLAGSTLVSPLHSRPTTPPPNTFNATHKPTPFSIATATASSSSSSQQDYVHPLFAPSSPTRRRERSPTGTTSGSKPKRLSSPPPPPSSTHPISDLVWSDAEITGHNPTDPTDDGYGINGIGFRPTPAMAQARRQKRRQQVAEWKRREAGDERRRRNERRARRGIGGYGRGEDGGMRYGGIGSGREVAGGGHERQRSLEGVKVVRFAEA